MIHRGRFALAAALLAVVLPAQAADVPKEIVVQGSKLPPERAAPVGLGQGRSPFAATPEEFLNMAQSQGGMPACKHGYMEIGFEAGKFTEAGQSYDVGYVIGRVKELKRDGKISCLWITSSEYDRPSFDTLEEALLGPLKVSLFWPEKGDKLSKPAKAGKR